MSVAVNERTNLCMQEHEYLYLCIYEILAACDTVAVASPGPDTGPGTGCFSQFI